MKYIIAFSILCLSLSMGYAQNNSVEKTEWKLDRTKLPIVPPPAPKFTELDARNTTQPEAFDVSAPEGAPNVLVVMLDDVGYAHSSTFGGPVNMPAAEMVARNGLKYTHFSVNPMCSPSRAALMTGRNAHTAHQGAVSEVATSYPGYDGKRPKSVALLAEMLQMNGYATAYIGKNHETPAWTVSASGPFDYWPTQNGFDKFYGFIGDEQNQWYPAIFDGTTAVDIDYEDPNFHLQEDFAREAAEWIQSQKSLNPAKPFFMYFSTGTAHAPHQVPQEYIDKYKGKFKNGWDELRKTTLKNQKELGIVDRNTVLAKKEPYIVDWKTLSTQEKRVHEKEMEVGSAFIEHADAQVMKVVQTIDKLGELDNTVIIYIMGDNGASAEGTISGLVNINYYYNNVLDDTASRAGEIDGFGGKDYNGIYSSGWAVAANTPFKWTKQVASGGGTFVGAIISYSDKIKAKGEVRHQFHHLIDVAPTILELAGLPEPTHVNGAKQIPMQGKSMAYSFENPNLTSNHKTQYFEGFGNRSIYHDGWYAQVIHKAAWEQKPRRSFQDDIWELYDFKNDFSMSKDLAKKMPEKLNEMKKLFDQEAIANNVYPLDDRVVERINPKIAGRPDLMFGRKELTVYSGMDHLFENVFINTKNTSFKITSEVTVTDRAEGVILAMGGRFGGYVFYAKDGKLCYNYNYLGDEKYETLATSELKEGRQLVEMEFEYEGDGVGKGGQVTLRVNNEVVGRGSVGKTMPFVYSTSEGASVGWDDSSPVSEDYAVGPKNQFNGTIEYVKIAIND
ncbi:arylsulfatase [Winogradskyella aurantiaca]|uniref:arylsulfatase n=1 Tax=Winogradskyella aurantiaca TaxID=2219558 RepID=UPI000E1D4ED7|nr:arylsulfatase [Winogradskyella aurantiaca]